MFDNKIIGIEAGDHYLHFVHGSVYRKHCKILHHKEMNLDLVDGQIMDAVAFQDAVMAFRDEYQIKTNKVAVVIKTTKAVIRFDSFPAMKPRELNQAVEHNAGKSFPIDTKAFSIDYKIISKKTKNINIMFVGLPDEISLAYTEALVGLKMKPLCLDIYQNCVVRYFSQFDKGNFTIISEFPLRINLIPVTQGEIKTVVDLTYSSEEVGLREMGKFIASQGLGSDKVYLLTDLEWIKRYLRSMKVEVRLETDLFIPLKGLLARGEF